MCGLRAICLFLVGFCLAPPPSISPRVGKLLTDLDLNQYNNLLIEEEIDLPVLAQLSEEQLSRIGIRTMGQRVRMMNAAQAMISVGQNVNENIVEEPEEDDDVGGVEGEENVEGQEEEHDVEGGEGEEDNEGREAEGVEEEEEGAVAPFEYEIVTKTTTTGKKTHVIYVGDNKYLSIKKNGQAFFYCNFVSVHHKCTSSFRVRYHDLQNPMDEIPEVETQPSPHVTSDGVGHLPEKVKRLKENMTEKICEAIKVDPLRPKTTSEM